MRNTFNNSLKDNNSSFNRIERFIDRLLSLIVLISLSLLYFGFTSAKDVQPFDLIFYTILLISISTSVLARLKAGINIKLLVIGNSILYKEDLDSTLIEDYKDKYELD